MEDAMLPIVESLQTAAPLWRALAAVTQAGIARLQALARLIRHRRDLAALATFDDRMLADIGLNRTDVRSALAEPFWRDPGGILIARAGERRGVAGRRRGATPERIITAPSIVPEPRRERSRIAYH
jgi:uncharacterized protein YjiS (DUF1127 family)